MEADLNEALAIGIKTIDFLDERIKEVIAQRDELLEALEDLVAYCSKEYPISELDEARDLIEKVKGE